MRILYNQVIAFFPNKIDIFLDLYIRNTFAAN